MLDQYFRSLQRAATKPIDGQKRKVRARTNKKRPSELNYEALERRMLLAAVTPDWAFGIGGTEYD
ncbi:MAG: hypothetical protein ACR2NM_17520, partial [Bythopirellula sp.]